MRIPLPRFSLAVWLLAGALLLSVALNVYCLAPRPGALVAWSADDDADDWDEDEDDDDNEALPSSRAVLADELRRARLQLSRCQARHPAPGPTTKTAAPAHQHPHG